MKRALLLLLTFVTLDTHAFTVESGEPKYPTNDVSFDIARNSCSNIGLSVNELQDFAEEAVDEYWNKVSTCALELKRGSISTADVSSEDATSQAGLNALYNKAETNRILIGCNSNATLFPANSTTLAVGSIMSGSAGMRGIVLINNTATTPFTTMSKRDKLATIAHEIGHAFGLGHSSDPIALMYYATGAKIQEMLSIDDFDGCTYLYPHKSPGSCGSVAIVDKDDPTSGGGMGQQTLMAFLIGLMSIFGLSRINFKNRRE